MEFIAYCTKGLEKVVEKEIVTCIKNVQVMQIVSKRIIFKTDQDFNALVNLRTVDDLGILVASLDDIASIEALLYGINKLNLKKYQKLVSQYREIDYNKFSLTPSFVGVNFSASEAVNSISQAVQLRYGWSFEEFNHTNFDIRIFIDHAKIYISIRLTKESLQHRSYKTYSKKGSLKPTIAASMVFLATERKENLKIVDNFCGSGTILCEAVIARNEVYGGDIDGESVVITKNNLKNLNYNTEDKIRMLDAVGTIWRDGFFDCAISNLPWDKQISVDSITSLYIGALKEYSRIQKSKGSLCLLVSKPELLIKHAKKIFSNCNINVFKISLLGQSPSIVVVKR